MKCSGSLEKRRHVEPLRGSTPPAITGCGLRPLDIVGSVKPFKVSRGLFFRSGPTLQTKNHKLSVYSITTRTSPFSTVWPGATLTSATLPSLGDLSSFSIFIASTTSPRRINQRDTSRTAARGHDYLVAVGDNVQVEASIVDQDREGGGPDAADINVELIRAQLYPERVGGKLLDFECVIGAREGGHVLRRHRRASPSTCRGVRASSRARQPRNFRTDGARRSSRGGCRAERPRQRRGRRRDGARRRRAPRLRDGTRAR